MQRKIKLDLSWSQSPRLIPHNFLSWNTWQVKYLEGSKSNHSNKETHSAPEKKNTGDKRTLKEGIFWPWLFDKVVQITRKKGLQSFLPQKTESLSVSKSCMDNGDFFSSASVHKTLKKMVRPRGIFQGFISLSESTEIFPKKSWQKGQDQTRQKTRA